MNFLTVGLVISDPDLRAEVQAILRPLPVRVGLETAGIGDPRAFTGKLESARPDVLILELAVAWDDLEGTIRAIRRTSSSPVVIGLHTSPEPETILRAIRAGASEYLYPPFEPGLPDALDRISADRVSVRGPQARGKAIAFLSAKGGCGATTIAASAGLELQRQTRQNILLADFDLDAGLLGFLFRSKSTYTVLDAMANVARLDFNFWKSLVSNGQPGIHVISSPGVNSNVEAGDHERLRHVLRFARTQYDWVVADLGRSLGVNVLSCLEEVEETYLVTTMDVPALYRARQIVHKLLASGYASSRLAAVLNRVPRSTDVTAQEVEKMLGIPLAGVLPEDAESVYEAAAEGKFLPPASPVGKRITSLVSRIAGTPPEKNKGKPA